MLCDRHRVHYPTRQARSRPSSPLEFSSHVGGFSWWLPFDYWLEGLGHLELTDYVIFEKRDDRLFYDSSRWLSFHPPCEVFNSNDQEFLLDLCERKGAE